MKSCAAPEVKTPPPNWARKGLRRLPSSKFCGWILTPSWSAALKGATALKQS